METPMPPQNIAVEDKTADIATETSPENFEPNAYISQIIHEDVLSVAEGLPYVENLGSPEGRQALAESLREQFANFIQTGTLNEMEIQALGQYIEEACKDAAMLCSIDVSFQTYTIVGEVGTFDNTRLKEVLDRLRRDNEKVSFESVSITIRPHAVDDTAGLDQFKFWLYKDQQTGMGVVDLSGKFKFDRLTNTIDFDGDGAFDQFQPIAEIDGKKEPIYRLNAGVRVAGNENDSDEPFIRIANPYETTLAPIGS